MTTTSTPAPRRRSTPIVAGGATAAAPPVTNKQLGVFAMTMLVLSAMIGGGAFNLPQNMAQSASLGAVLIAWVISGLGIYFLARTFQVLADIKPEMTSGIYMYSRAGFGSLAGFMIAWGYWLSAAFGNVGFGVLLMDALNYFVPPYFKGGNTWQAVLLASTVIWFMNWMVLRGVKGAASLNTIGTIAKFVPILLFLVVVLFTMKAGLFGSDFWGNLASHSLKDQPLGSVLDQVKSTMLVTLWVYIGIEGAVVMSDRADAKTVSRATLLGFIGATLIYVLVSVLPFGVYSQGELSGMAPPSTAFILGQILGKWAEWFVNVGVVIAILSSWLVWTMLVAELPWAGAKDGTYPKVFAKTNSKGTASVALWTSSALMQVAMLLVYFSNNAWNIMLSITGVVILPAYIGSTAYLWRIMATGQYPATGKTSKAVCWFVSIVGTLYGLWLCYAAGLQFMLAGAICFALGLIVFVWARKEQVQPGESVFNKVELLVALALVVLAVVALWMLVAGQLPQVFTPT